MLKIQKQLKKEVIFAVSATKFQKGIGEPSSVIEADFPTGYYLWLKDQQLVKNWVFNFYF